MSNREADGSFVSSAPDVLSSIGPCPICKRELSGHSYSLLASEVVDRKSGQESLITFFESLKNRDWKRLLKAGNWEGLSDNVELYGIVCGGAVVLVVIRSPFELYDDDEILLVETVAEEDSRLLLGLAKDKTWKTLK